MHNTCKYTAEENIIHSSIQHVCNNSSSKYIAKLTREILILKRSCPTTSYVATMFNPTIGQWAHQYLSTTATPELSMICTRN